MKREVALAAGGVVTAAILWSIGAAELHTVEAASTACPAGYFMNSFGYPPSSCIQPTYSDFLPGALPNSTTATTQTSTDNTTKVATDAFVQTVAQAAAQAPSDPVALPNGSTAVTQGTTDASTKVATDAFAQAAASAPNGAVTLPNGSTAVTQTTGDNTTKVATDVFVNASISADTATTFASPPALGSTAPAAVNGTSITGQTVTVSTPATDTSHLPNVYRTAGGLLDTQGQPVYSHGQPTNPSNISSTSFQMEGLGTICAFTPGRSGVVDFSIDGSVGNTTSADGVQIQVAYGTGTAPVNAASATGTVITNAKVLSSGGANLTYPFSMHSLAAFIVGTAYWFDIQAKTVTGGAVILSGLDCVWNEK